MVTRESDIVGGAVQHDTLRLASQLIACRSITPADDGTLDLITSRLTGAGFLCQRIDRGGVSNLWAQHGTTPPVICLAGHLDVVPPGPVERWTSDPFTPVERDGFLYGRGAADMKGSIAAMVTAAERVVGMQRASGSVALLLTSDEEGEAKDGTAAVVDWLRRRNMMIDACILGEPTSSARLGDTLKNGRRGSLTGRLRVNGIQSHIAYPERGRNPIHHALPALAELARTHWDRGNRYFPPTSFQIASVEAGAGAHNVIPGSLEAAFNFRFSPESTVDGLKNRTVRILESHGVDYTLEWTLFAEPFMTAGGVLLDALREAIAEVTGITAEMSTSGGTSDGRFLKDIAREVAEFGPVNESIHKVDEHVKVSDLGRLSAIYEHAVLTLLGTRV